MTRKAAMNQLFNLIQDEYDIKSASDIEAALLDMFGGFIEQALEAELDQHLGYSRYDFRHKSTSNTRNGRKPKTIQTRLGKTTVQAPRDREGSFQPQIVPKRQTNVIGIEDKILSLYAKGLSTRDISKTLEEIYGFETSHETISAVTDKVIPLIQEWQQRPLEPVYPIIYLDALHVKMRDGISASNKAVYCVIGVSLEGHKDVLSLSIGEAESASYWMSLLDELKARGVQDICIACVDGLSGFKQAIQAVFPHALVQRCLVHLIRQSTKFVSYQDRKSFCYDLKQIYQAISQSAAEQAFKTFKEKWNRLVPLAVRVWENNIEEVYQLFKFPKEIRKMIYTTNAIESYNSQLRKVLKGKGAFPNETSVMKLIYLQTIEVTKKWQRQISNWSQILNQLLILYPDRLTPYL
ncbi:IS256 family transposase [Turicibacter sanguinis]|uniref:IS256 family transposase n=1 Tax=Turicibacter sanguinis TaxID=154288 RepID=UPI001E463243|nr:IS256 family transposase [Turicibacter sanguinis]